MTKEFNLSDKEFGIEGVMKKYWKDDVKKAVKELKMFSLKLNCVEHACTHKLLVKIDKIFGDKLI